MNDSYASVWTIDQTRFPAGAGASAAEIFGFVLSYAILAPSGHNGQPWLFRIDGDELHVLADRDRALPMVDPQDREMLISCAGTIYLIKVALRHFGCRPVIALLPDPADPDLLAVIRLGESATPPGTRDLFDAIAARHSNRRAYQARPIPESHADRLLRAAASEGAWLTLLSDRDTIRVTADLIGLGDRIKWRDTEFRRELAGRLIPNRGRRRDGMPGYAFGLPGPLAGLAPGVTRRADLGPLRASADRKLALATPCLAVIGTDEDSPAAWLAAGQAMGHVLLQATADGLATSFLSQPIEVEALRPAMSTLTGRSGYPQLLLRVGYPRHPSRPSPRRPLSEVLACARKPGTGPRPASTTSSQETPR
jgi:hypothetical protein